jgi:hypothetical protein
MSNLADFTKRVLALFSKSITDQVFLSIQNDRKLMHEYLKLVEEKGLTVVNQQIGRSVKKRFGLSNDDQRQEEPKSTLIQSHTKFE